jgi:glyoxylase-like metal-dependent hydrolase (beta-lactamase superfamily II)
MLPAKSPTLPPATHTNAVLIGGTIAGGGDAILVDPATPWPEEQERFDRQLSACLGGHRITAIVCTHHHVDHVGDVERLRQKWHVPVWAHKLTAERVDFKIDRLLEDGDVIACPPRKLRVVFTPGHAQGHICLFDEDARMLIAGDMVAGVGSIIIDPPEGHMGTYLASLEKLIALEPRALVPSHGPLLVDGTGRLREQLEHRRKRQAAVLASVPVAPGTTISAIVQSVYGVDTPPAMWAFAERSVMAALELAVERQEVNTDGSRWWRTASG